jgi:putative endonuclease
LDRKNSRQDLGRWGEAVAADYLQAHGYSILARNVHTPHGELDIVAAKEASIIFVEVKTRRSHSFAYPEASVTSRKQAYLVSAAQAYLDLHPESPDTWQFDVIAVEGGPGRETHIEHFENVIS